MIRAGVIEAAVVAELGVTDAPFALAIVKSVRETVAQWAAEYPAMAESMPPFSVTVTSPVQPV